MWASEHLRLVVLGEHADALVWVEVWLRGGDFLKISMVCGHWVGRIDFLHGCAGMEQAADLQSCSRFDLIQRD